MHLQQPASACRPQGQSLILATRNSDQSTTYNKLCPHNIGGFFETISTIGKKLDLKFETRLEYLWQTLATTNHFPIINWRRAGLRSLQPKLLEPTAVGALRTSERKLSQQASDVLEQGGQT